MVEVNIITAERLEGFPPPLNRALWGDQTVYVQTKDQMCFYSADGSGAGQSHLQWAHRQGWPLSLWVGRHRWGHTQHFAKGSCTQGARSHPRKDALGLSVMRFSPFCESWQSINCAAQEQRRGNKAISATIWREQVGRVEGAGCLLHSLLLLTLAHACVHMSWSNRSGC